MSEAVVAKRYADALFQLATDHQNLDKLTSELAVVKDVFQSNDELIDLLNHPRISHQDKMNLIDNAFGQCEKDLIHMLKILVERHRIIYISDVIDHFKQLYNEANGMAAATVYSVRALSEDEKTKVEASLTKQLNKEKVSINNVIDPTVLGGLKIRVGNTIYDGSISSKLNRLKHNIGAATI